MLVASPEGWPEGHVNRGLEEWRRQAERLRDSWKEARIEVDEIRPVGQDRVVTTIRHITTGKEPGIAFDTSMPAAFFLRDRKITRAAYYWNLAEALKAAGLSE